jgi:hypothetical protein
MLTKNALYDDPWNAVYLPLPANAPADLLESARFAAYLVCCNTHPGTAHGSAFIDPSDPHLSPSPVRARAATTTRMPWPGFRNLRLACPPRRAYALARRAYPHLSKPM